MKKENILPFILCCLFGFSITHLVQLSKIETDIREIKHMVNEVICTALEMEETWAEQ